MLDFVGIGAQKAGTTWLYQILGKHPHVRFPAGKEIHFWDQQYDRGLDWYRSLFECEPDKRKGEITPAYAILPRTRIVEFRRICPEIRIIYLLRNPIERAWSSALMALQRAEMELEEASDQWFIDHFRSVGSLARGDYAVCLHNWYAEFSHAQLLVKRYEDIASQPRQLLQAVCEHINVSADPLERLNHNVVSQRIQSPPLKITTISISDRLLPVLRELYYPRIERLEGLLGDDFSDWRI